MHTINTEFDNGRGQKLPAILDHLSEILEPGRSEIERSGTSEILLAGRKIRIGRALMDELGDRGHNDVGQEIAERTPSSEENRVPFSRVMKCELSTSCQSTTGPAPIRFSIFAVSINLSMS